MNLFKRFFGHLKTVSTHRREVRRLCFKLGLYKRGILHDLSKYSPTEFWNGVRFFTGEKSPHVGERLEYGYSKAWLHHKAKNKHHSDYWIDIFDRQPTPVDMPAEYFAEMFCDRVAACKIYLKEKYTDASPLEYYLTHKRENYMSDRTKDKLKYFLMHLKDFGEEKTFQVLKDQLIRGDLDNKKIWF